MIEFYEPPESGKGIKVTELIKCADFTQKEKEIIDNMVKGIAVEEGVRSVLQGEKNTYEIEVEGIRIIGTPDVDKEYVLIEVKSGKNIVTFAQGVLQASIYAYMSKKPTYLYFVGIGIVSVNPITYDDLKKLIHERRLPRALECYVCDRRVYCPVANDYIIDYKKYINEIIVFNHKEKKREKVSLEQFLKLLR